jgi:hypothetical protein
MEEILQKRVENLPVVSRCLNFSGKINILIGKQISKRFLVIEKATADTACSAAILRDSETH